MSKMEIKAFCLDWHVKNSDAFSDILVTPLSKHANIRLSAWDGNRVNGKISSSLPVIFCMLPPPESLLKNLKLKIIWIPMWDQAQGYDQVWWNNLPKNLRVVAFSDKVYEKATSAGLKTLRCKYYIKPNESQRVSWDNGKIIFYWNRVGLLSPRFLEKLCKVVDAGELLFKGEIDPRIEKNKHYLLRQYINKTKVLNVPTTKTRDEFHQLIESANVVISPRLTEGAGMVFLEAMARGCAVIAHDAPTMSEYIVHNHNGVLLRNDYRSTKDKIHAKLARRRTDSSEQTNFLLSESQPWGELGALKYQKLGDQAFLDCQFGYEEWSKSINTYASFLLDW